MPLTRRQREVYDYVARFIAEQGYGPSYSEIAEGLGLRSVATVHKHMVTLQKKGYITRGFNQSRSVELSERAAPGGGAHPAGAAPGHPALHDDAPRAVDLPLVGTIAAGRPITAIEEQETISVPETMLRRGDTYALRVRGNSMIDEHICDGDYVLCEQRDTASDGEVVVALIDEEEATLKKLFREPGGQVRLQPRNPTLEPMVMAADRVRVQGVVVGLLRRYA